MIRLLIVDDEVIIRNGLSSVIDWQGLGFTLLAPAASAEEALERLMEEKPHVILTDIRMAGQSGLDLAREAHLFNPQIETMILTGYDDFKYAQQAIRFGVSDYLLKTSRPEEIIRTMMKAKQRILQRREEERQDHTHRVIYRNRLLERLLTEAAREDSLPLEWAEHLPQVQLPPVGGESLQAVIIKTSGWGNQPQIHSLLLFAVDNCLNNLLECETLLRKDDIALVLRNASSTAGQRLLKHASAQIRQTLKCELFAAIGTEVKHFKDLHESYRQALYAASFQGLTEATDSVAYEQIKDRSGGRTVCSLEEEAELASLLQNGSPIELKAWAMNIIGRQLHDPELTPDSLRAFVISIIVSGHRWLERVMRAIGKGDLSPLLCGKDLPESFNLFKEPAETLFTQLITIRDAYHKSAVDGPSSYIQQAVAYIQAHLACNISLQQVAGAVHLHPHHFSEVFKREMGINYLEFVTRERMRRAEELLTQSPAKISEIAKSVGYEDIKYFGQLFKKHTGKTPSEFRNKP